MIATFRDLLALLTPYERRRGLVVLLLMIAMAGFEVAGIASIMPFLSVMGNPSVIEDTPALAYAYDWFGFTSTDDFLVALASLGIVVLTLSSLVRIAAQYGMIRFANMRRHSLSRRLLYGHLCRPYEDFLNSNAADISKSVLSEVDVLIAQVVTPAVHVVAYSLVTASVVILLFIIEPVLAASLTGGVGGFYVLTFLALRRKLARGGVRRLEANRQRFRAAADAIAGIQELKVLGREQAFFSAFDPASDTFSRQAAIVEVLSKLPKRVIEMLGFIGVLGAAIFLVRTRQDLGGALPILGVYAVAGYKLLPAMQELYQGASKLRFGHPALLGILEDLRDVGSLSQLDRGTLMPLAPQRQIELENLAFHYPHSQQEIFQDLCLTVPAGTSVAVLGRSGAGKSTLLKILLGLLRPTAGRILLDGSPLSPELVPCWQRAIGYVPQELFLLDASVRQNIAFGVAETDIDEQAIERAAHRAQIHDVIQNLDEGYDTIIGDRGIRLSGGQRQRLAIARALYRAPPVLVLDEATSALDEITEDTIVDDLLGDRNLTIIVVTHRPSLARLCDQMLELDMRSGEKVLVPTSCG